MVDINRECLKHYTNGEYRCQACGFPIKSPYHYYLHHVKNNGKDHIALIIKETGNGASFHYGKRGISSAPFRAYLYDTNFKTDAEFPLVVLCDDCHTFKHKHGRFPTSREIISIHQRNINYHADALAHIVDRPNEELRAQTTMEDFYK